jgi:hypothetical protein
MESTEVRCTDGAYLCVSITKLNGDISHKLILESDGLYTGDCLYDGRFSVRYVADGADVNGGLLADDFRTQGIEVVEVNVDSLQVLGDLRDISIAGHCCGCHLG